MIENILNNYRQVTVKVIIAPDSYKGSLSALEVTASIERGLRKALPDVMTHCIPISDGGEGLVEALVTATGGRIQYLTVRGPLGEPVSAHWGILGDCKTAVIEMAAASGLPLIAPELRDPCMTSTYGVGELIKGALDVGIRGMIIGIGGSATNDGGTGMAKALGAKFFDESGFDLPLGGAALLNLSRIDTSKLDSRLRDTKMVVACDVDNPLCGSKGASAVYGPQKGATPEMVELLDSALRNYANVAGDYLGKDISEIPGSGAAGGLGAGLILFTNAKLRPGVEIVLEAVNFAKIVQEVDLVITGEGMSDFQTAFGKAPVGVAAIAKHYNKPVICLSGGLGEGVDELFNHGIDAIMSVVPGPISLQEAMSNASGLVESAAFRLGKLLKTGMALKCDQDNQ